MARTLALIDRFLPDYRRRHIFTTKIRLVAFVSFWALFLFFLGGVLGQARAIAGIVLGCFFLTGFAYSNIIAGRWLLPSFILELVSDLAAITVVVYMTDGPYSPYFTIYLFYAMAAGAIYNHYLAGFVAVCSAAFYGAFLLLCEWEVIPPLIINYGDRLPTPSYTPFAHFLFTVIFLCGIVYTVKVAIYFSQERERALEKRNRELTALHRVSSAVRSIAVLRNVISEVLFGILDGLGFETAILLHFDKERGTIRVYTPGRHSRLGEIENALGVKLAGVEFPLAALSSPALAEIMRQRTIFRRSISEMVEGWGGVFTKDGCDAAQKLLGINKIVAVPLVLEGTVLGALLGFSRDAYLEDQQVSTLESFANQAAMSLEAAMLIDKLRRVNEELKRANDVKSEFLATMSHELRTPLTAIIGFSELLMEGVMGDLSDEQRDSLREVLHNAADLLDLINSLLDLTKIESGRMRFDASEFKVGATVERVVGTIAPLVRKKNQKFEVDIAHDLPIFYGDERKVQQIVINLLANANKFTPSGGRISISVQFCRSPDDMQREYGTLHRDLVKDMLSGGWIEIDVADSGIGIPKGEQEKIFEMFHQADSSVTRSFGGTGLGLALAKRFVEMHGGSIWVESEEGEGARFTVVLPLKRRY